MKYVVRSSKSITSAKTKKPTFAQRRNAAAAEIERMYKELETYGYSNVRARFNLIAQADSKITVDDVPKIVEITEEWMDLVHKYVSNTATIDTVFVDTVKLTLSMTNKCPELSDYDLSDSGYGDSNIMINYNSKWVPLCNAVRIDINNPDEGLQELESILNSTNDFTCNYDIKYADKFDKWQDKLDECESLDLESACKKLAYFSNYPIGVRCPSLSVEFVDDIARIYDGSTNTTLVEVDIDDFCEDVIDIAHQTRLQTDFNRKYERYVLQLYRNS